jgi:hypothetical protein
MLSRKVQSPSYSGLKSKVWSVVITYGELSLAYLGSNAVTIIQHVREVTGGSLWLILHITLVKEFCDKRNNDIHSLSEDVLNSLGI